MKKAAKKSARKNPAKKNPTKKNPTKRPVKTVIGREAAEARRVRANVVYDTLAAEYPSAHCELDYRSPYELLVATILSAQCTDKRVNIVTPSLFARYPNPAALAAADRAELEGMIQSTGFFRSKAKSLTGMAQAVVRHHGGAVPSTMDDLVDLPGVGRKTANVVLGNAFGINEGVVVDTHVARLSDRLRFTRNTDPVKIEQDLVALFERDRWTLLSHLLIWHGRRVCDARKPKCSRCVIAKNCPSAFVVAGAE